VRQEVGALRDAFAIERSFPQRVETDQHAVLFEDQGFAKTAKELGLRLDAFCQKLLVPLKLARLPGARVGPVAILPPTEYDAHAPASTQAAWVPRLGLLLLRGSAPGDLSWEQGLAVSECWVQRIAPGLPAWAEAGLAAYCVEAALGKAPPGWVERLRAQGPWTAEQWRRLFALDRAALQADPLARARAWSLVRLADWRPPLKRELSKLIEQAAAGQSPDWAPYTGLDLPATAPELDQLLEKRPSPR
jgi:hypothetical protein